MGLKSALIRRDSTPYLFQKMKNRTFTKILPDISISKSVPTPIKIALFTSSQVSTHPSDYLSCTNRRLSGVSSRLSCINRQSSCAKSRLFGVVVRLFVLYHRLFGVDCWLDKVVGRLFVLDSRLFILDSRLFIEERQLFKPEQRLFAQKRNKCSTPSRCATSGRTNVVHLQGVLHQEEKM